MITPVIQFSNGHFTSTGKWQETYTVSEKMRIALNKATGYQWDNQHYILLDRSGGQALNLMIVKEGISAWSCKTGSFIGSITEPEWDKDPYQAAIKLELWAIEAGNGKVLCSECGKWVKSYVSFSYTGSVCKKCYDPSKHKKPDTRGD